MGNVYSITLCDRDLHHVPDDIYKHHKHVAKLLLRRNNIQEIPPEIKVLTNLVELSLRDNLLTTVPIEITNLRLLQKLSLASNRLQEPPEPIAAFSQLTWLSLASNTLTTLPDSFAQLQKLTSLDLQRNRFVNIPDCIFAMRSLTILLLQKNRITTISSKIGYCTQLVSLNLSYNRIQQLPVEMKECRNLQHLLLSVNSIQALPSVLCESWINLLNLDLHTNDLKALPAQLGGLKTLRRLNVAINKIEEIPPSIGQLQLLEWLNLNDNKLVTLPSTMDQMQKLVKMGIVQNKLQTLPEALARLNVLYKLDCRRNEIEYLPSAFKDMQGIHSLLLEENPLSYRYGVSNYTRQPPTLLELAARAVLDRYNPQDADSSIVSSSSAIISPGSSPLESPSVTSNSGMTEHAGTGISNLIPTMADLGLTKASTLPPPVGSQCYGPPQKSRYSFFSRACATVHPLQSSKLSRAATVATPHISDSSSSSSSSTSPSSTSLVTSLTSSSLTPGSLTVGNNTNNNGRPRKYKSSPRGLKPPSIFSRSRGHNDKARIQSQPQPNSAASSLVTSSLTPNGGARAKTLTRIERLLDPEVSLLPLPLIDLLSLPTTTCDYCNRRMCTSGWVDFLEPAKLGSSRTIIPVRHRMCSLTCVRRQHRDSFGGELTDLFESTDFHIGSNGEMIGSRPIVPGELDEYLIEAVQEAAEAAGISITHLLQQHQAQQQGEGQGVGMEETQSTQDQPINGVLPPMPGAIPGVPGTTGSVASSMLRQTTARLRRSRSRPTTPIEIQVDAQGQLRRVVYRQQRSTSHRRRLLETFRSLSQVGQANGLGGNGVGGGLGGLGVLTAAGIGNQIAHNAFGIAGANGGGNGGGGGDGNNNGGGDATRGEHHALLKHLNMAEEQHNSNNSGTGDSTVNNNGSKSNKKYTSPFSQFNISSTDVLDTIEKARCPDCNKNVRYFCNRCLKLVNCTPGAIPQLKLPIKLDVIKHEQERDGKSTALHAKILAPDDVEVYAWKDMPKYENVDRLLLLFPSPGAKQLSEIDPASFDKLVVIDGTWEQANKMSKSDSPLLRMKRVTIAPHETLFWRHQRKASDHLATIEAIYFFLREYHETYLTAVPPTSLSSTTAPAGTAALSTSQGEPCNDTTTNHNNNNTTTGQTESTTISTVPPSTLQQHQQSPESSSSSSISTSKVITPHKEWIDSHQLGPYTNQFDDMLWFYKYFYELIQKTYRERTDGREFTLKHTKGYIQYDPEDERQQ
ncbi:DTW domain-containing protein 1 [Linnemannia gamsii]|uniref:tRNA-uridine aminocarboxypropyltransferase n=1 Tax=Linnemannia gamsii TaxID=64522 RepID=A0ABQ7KCE1_9FUNG|nr:DTW domain-containing protein 1 [Linnemannia gamsii]